MNKNKTTTTTTEKPVSTTKTEQPVAAKATKATPKKTSSSQSSPKKAETVAPKIIAEQPNTALVTEATPEIPSPAPAPASPKKVKAAAPKQVAVTSELSIRERVGLTAGSIWHYLSENGATSVSKLITALTEEEKIIQRSIGWLAQEDQITIDTTGRIETIALKA